MLNIKHCLCTGCPEIAADWPSSRATLTDSAFSLASLQMQTFLSQQSMASSNNNQPLLLRERPSQSTNRVNLWSWKSRRTSVCQPNPVSGTSQLTRNSRQRHFPYKCLAQADSSYMVFIWIELRISHARISILHLKFLFQSLILKRLEGPESKSFVHRMARKACVRAAIMVENLSTIEHW
jgi:hypothetical protein